MANYLSILAETIRTNRDQPALTDFYLTEDGTAQDTSRGNHYTYGEMYAELCRVAELLTSLGLQKGDHIAICGANSAHWCIAYLAIAKMQGVSVTVMHSLMPDEMARLIAFSDAKALFTDADIWAELKSQSIPQVESVIGLENWEVLKGKMQIISLPFREELEVGFPSFPSFSPDDLVMICFTSGTSGKPKGVMLSHGNIGHGVHVSLDSMPDCTRKNYLSVLPFPHIFGFVGDVIDHLIRAHHICICTEISRINEAVDIVHPYFYMTVPMLLETILTKENQSQFDFKWVNLGGAKISEKLRMAINSSHIKYAIMYGATECLLAANSEPSAHQNPDCVGRACEGVSISISPAGEILVKGENVMLGYYKDPEATAAKIDSDGWLHTGDKGHLDKDGYLYVEGRLEQDIIVLPNGENIRPDNIEALINALPEVSESLVLARDGHLVAIVVPSIVYSATSASRETIATSENSATSPSSSLRRAILRTVNPQLPLFSQLYDVEITSEPLARTEKQTIKRYLYK